MNIYVVRIGERHHLFKDQDRSSLCGIEFGSINGTFELPMAPSIACIDCLAWIAGKEYKAAAPKILQPEVVYPFE